MLTGSPWRSLPYDLRPWHTVYQQTRHWLRAGVFEVIVADLRTLIPLGEGKPVEPTAAVFDSRMLQGSIEGVIENGDRSGYHGHKECKGSKLHLTVDTLGEFLALVATPAYEKDHSQVAELADREHDQAGVYR